MLGAVFSATVIQTEQCEQSALRGRMLREGNPEAVPVKLQRRSLAALPAFKRKFLSGGCKLVSL